MAEDETLGLPVPPKQSVAEWLMKKLRGYSRRDFMDFIQITFTVALLMLAFYYGKAVGLDEINYAQDIWRNSQFVASLPIEFANAKDIYCSNKFMPASSWIGR